MGFLSNLWHGKGHELFDQIAADLAGLMQQRIREAIKSGATGEEAARQAIDEAASQIRVLQDERGLNAAGYARIMRSLVNALVMMGSERGLAEKIKNQVREQAPVLRSARPLDRT